MPGESPAFFYSCLSRKEFAVYSLRRALISILLLALILLWATPALSYVNEYRSAFQISVGTHPRCVRKILMVTAVSLYPHARPMLGFDVIAMMEALSVIK